MHKATLSVCSLTLMMNWESSKETSSTTQVLPNHLKEGFGH